MKNCVLYSQMYFFDRKSDILYQKWLFYDFKNVFYVKNQYFYFKNTDFEFENDYFFIFILGTARFCCTLNHFLDLFSPLAYYLSLFSKVLILIYDLFNLMEMNSTRAKGINQK